jgi:hypothetical protein
LISGSIIEIERAVAREGSVDGATDTVSYTVHLSHPRVPFGFLLGEYELTDVLNAYIDENPKFAKNDNLNFLIMPINKLQKVAFSNFFVHEYKMEKVNASYKEKHPDADMSGYEPHNWRIFVIEIHNTQPGPPEAWGMLTLTDQAVIYDERGQVDRVL